MEPAFLDKLPSRFRKRFRGNVITFAVLLALFMIPPRCGPYGIVAFFTIAWLASTSFYLTRLLAAPRPSPRPFVLLGIITALLAYPIAVGWIYRTFDGTGLLAVICAWVLWFILAIAYRRIVFPSVFGANRRSFLGEWRAVRAARAEVRVERDGLIEELRDKPC